VGRADHLFAPAALVITARGPLPPSRHGAIYARGNVLGIDDLLSGIGQHEPSFLACLRVNLAVASPWPGRNSIGVLSGKLNDLPSKVTPPEHGFTSGVSRA